MVPISSNASAYPEHCRRFKNSDDNRANIRRADGVPGASHRMFYLFLITTLQGNIPLL